MRRVSLNPCGRLNTITGKNLHFNVLTDCWDGTYTLGRFVDWDDAGKHKKILIGGFGGAGAAGDLVDLHHGQTNKWLGQILIEATFEGGAAGLWAIHRAVGNSIRFATLD